MAKEDPNALLVGHVGQKVVLMKDGKVLMCRGYDFSTRWDFPGGRIHSEEQPREGLIREVKEEIGVDIEVGKPLYACSSTENKNGTARYYVVFEGRFLNPNSEFTVADDEIQELRWVGAREAESLEMWEDWRVLLKEYFKTHAS